MNATETPVEAAIADLRLGPPSRWLWGTTIVGALAFIGTQIWGFDTPPDANMGNLVKIMFEGFDPTSLSGWKYSW